MGDRTAVIAQIREALGRVRLPFADELACQRAIAEVLAGLGLPFAREYALSGGRGRIDFFLAEHQLGLEVKVQGSPSAVVRQVGRYATAPEIGALVLVTGRAALGAALPSVVLGTPLHVVATWRGGL